MTAPLNTGFADKLLNWFDLHGRKDLPWQQNKTPYRVWVSEIMLQQTQVSTVIPYYQRFMQRFPDIAALAAASQDEVLAHWAGLGYYARGRNLHKAAQTIVGQHNAEFPHTFDDVVALPGIGRSTASAILAISRQQHHAILDGNVKRVLARLHGIEGWPGDKKIETEMWSLAERHTPAARVDEFTQAIMDMGATLCRRSKPLCHACPMQSDCEAFHHNLQTSLPTPRPKKKIPTRSTCMLVLQNAGGEILLQKRPPSGIWGGLLSLPELENPADIEDWCARKFGGAIIESVRGKEALRHTFSHFHLDIQPFVAQISHQSTLESHWVMEESASVWYKAEQLDSLGLPAPVKRILADALNEPAASRQELTS